jgi:hypothetical protein
MEQYAGTGVVLHGSGWFASLNTLLKFRTVGMVFVALIKTAHKGVPVKETTSWEIRILQTVTGMKVMKLVNAYLALKYLTDRE